MTIWWLLMIVVLVAALAAGFIWLAVSLSKIGQKKPLTAANLENAPEEDVEHIFNREFREELRNRGRLHFEKIINDNAMFLQQDLRLTTSQLNEYMKKEISSKLQDEFTKYEQSIEDAKQLAIESIKRTNLAIDEQRKMLGEQIQAEISSEKEHLLSAFKDNMAGVINHYLIGAIGNQIDLNDQIDYILADLESNKEAILEDIRNGS